MTLICLKCGLKIEKSKERYGLHVECFLDWFGLKEIEEFSDIYSRSLSQSQGKQINSSFFHGKFRKYSARLGGDSYILKVQQNEYPELPATEFISNQIFVALGIQVPQHYLVRFNEEELCFVTKNFISNSNPATLVHMYHFVESGEEYNCENLVRIIGEKTGRRIDQEKFAFLTLVDSLIGNNDRHGRNLGFIQNSKRMRLAPFYDNPSALGVEEATFLGADLQPRGAIYTKRSNEPTINDYILEWQRLGFGKVVEELKDKLILENITEIINKSPLSKKRKEAFLRLITYRSQQLCAN